MMIEILIFIIGFMAGVMVGALLGQVILPHELWKRRYPQLSTKQQQSTVRPITASGATKPPRAPLPMKGFVYGTGPAPTIPPPPKPTRGQQFTNRPVVPIVLAEPPPPPPSKFGCKT